MCLVLGSYLDTCVLTEITVTSDHVNQYIAQKLDEDNRHGSAEALRPVDLSLALATVSYLIIFS